MKKSAGNIGSALVWGTVSAFNIRSFLLAVGGAIIVLWVFSLIAKK